jgi:hypothetical protein
LTVEQDTNNNFLNKMQNNIPALLVDSHVGNEIKSAASSTGPNTTGFTSGSITKGKSFNAPLDVRGQE